MIYTMLIKCICGKEINYLNNDVGEFVNHFISLKHIIYNDNFINNEELTSLLLQTGSYMYLQFENIPERFNIILDEYKKKQDELKLHASIIKFLRLINYLLKGK